MGILRSFTQHKQHVSGIVSDFRNKMAPKLRGSSFIWEVFYTFLFLFNPFNGQIIAVNGVLCVRGYWDVPEVKDDSRDQLLKWFNNQIQQTGFSDLKDTLYFPQSSGERLSASRK